MTGTLYRSQDGIWFVRSVGKSKDTPTLDTVEDYLLHPYDETDYDYEYTMTHSVGFIPKDVKFEVSESIHFISQSDEPPRSVTIRYAKLINE